MKIRNTKANKPTAEALSASTWKAVMIAPAAPPPGFISLREIASEVGLGMTRTKEKLSILLRAGKIRRVRVGPSGAYYYSILAADKP
jgi:hypothetical protein